MVPREEKFKGDSTEKKGLGRRGEEMKKTLLPGLFFLINFLFPLRRHRGRPPVRGGGRDHRCLRLIP